MTDSSRATVRKKSSHGFTLVELLVVLGIIIMIMGILAPSMGGILKGKKIEQAISGVTLALESARMEARSQNAYVWTGIAQVPSSQSPSGQDEIWLMNFRVKPDKKRLPSDASGGGVAVPVSPLTRIEGVGIIPQGNLPAAFPAFEEIAARAEDFSGTPDSNTPLKWVKGGSNGTQLFSKQILFTPRGEALREEGNPELPNPLPYMFLCLAQTINGKPIPSSKDAAVIVIAGFNGRITALRPGKGPAPAPSKETP